MTIAMNILAHLLAVYEASVMMLINEVPMMVHLQDLFEKSVVVLVASL